MPTAPRQAAVVRSLSLVLAVAVGLGACSASKAKPSSTPPTSTSTSSGGTATTGSGTGQTAVSSSDAVARARDALTNAGVSVDGRSPTVSLAGGSYSVVFPPSADQLGGRYSATVDASTGKVTDVQIER